MKMWLDITCVYLVAIHFVCTFCWESAWRVMCCLASFYVYLTVKHIVINFIFCIQQVNNSKHANNNIHFNHDVFPISLHLPHLLWQQCHQSHCNEQCHLPNSSQVSVHD